MKEAVSPIVEMLARFDEINAKFANPDADLVTLVVGAWLDHHLRDYKNTVIAITHDRYFLDNIAG